MTYAGRLDPLAEGLMIVLTGDDCMKKDEYTNMSKQYEVHSACLASATDTYDLLGIVKSPLEMLSEFYKLFCSKICSDARAVARVKRLL
jgi:tRNA U55 pseudouridine synthase TruB